MSTTPGGTGDETPKLSAALRELLHHAEHGTLLYHPARSENDSPDWVIPHPQPARAMRRVTRSGNALQKLGLIEPGPPRPRPASRSRLGVLTDAGRRARDAHPLPHAWDDPRGREQRTCTRCNLHIFYGRQPTSKGGGQFNFTNAAYAWAWREADQFQYARGLRGLPSCIPAGVPAARTPQPTVPPTAARPWQPSAAAPLSATKGTD